MPTSLEGALVLIAFVLPGALFTWVLEGQCGAWGTKQTDRVLRFAGTSAVYHAFLAPLTYWLWSNYLSAGRLRGGTAGLTPIALVAVELTVVPGLLGFVAGRAAHADRPWVSPIVGKQPVPTAWDYYFRQEQSAWVRARFADGRWVGGLFRNVPSEGRRSYASGYPEAGELLLAYAADLDQTTGLFVLGNNNYPKLGDSLLIRFADVTELYFERFEEE